jgi:tripartite-type tricarboxylate transporter receptor subunit TctC
MTDLMGGQIQAAFPLLSPAMEHIRGDSLRALAVTAATRAKALPDVPTLGEFVFGYDASGWWGISAPPNTPRGIIERLNREINASLADPRLNQRIVEFGDEPFRGSPSEFGGFITQFTEKWAKIIREAGIKAG